MPSSISTSSWASNSSSMRDVWRALRAISDMPFLWLSSSSRVMMGRKTSCSSKRKRQLGSCISTLVSRTKILVTAGFLVAAGLRGMEWAFGWGGGRLKGFDEIEHFLGVAGDLHPAPFAAQYAAAVDDEGAAFDAAHLLAVHVLHFHDAEQRAHRLVAVRTEFEGKILLGLEVLVRFDAVPRDAEDHRVDRRKLLVQIAELLAFGGAARRAVLGVEVDHHHLAGLGGKIESLAAGGRQGEVGNSCIEHAAAFS